MKTITETNICLVEVINHTIDRYLSSKRRKQMLRSMIILNVIYIVIFGVIAFVESLSLLLLLYRYYTDLRLDVKTFVILVVKLSTLLAIIGGHICGLFGILHRNRYLLFISSFVGFNAFLLYLCLIVFHFYQIPVIVLMFGIFSTNNQLILSFLSFIISLNIVYRNRKICLNSA